MKLILASGSPRRRELMGLIKACEVEIIPAQGEEKPHPELSVIELVQELARAKCAEIAALHPDETVIGADTVVSIDGEVMGKPRDDADAERMLRRLSGASHEVLTGIAVYHKGEIRTSYEETKVHFRKIDDTELSAYIATGEPLDKAGAYGIQGYAGLFVEGIEGDYFNVMGLPVCRLGIMLKELGVNLL